MINSFVDLFKLLFNSCIQFDYIFYVLSASCLIAVVSTAFKYLLKGKY